MMPIIAGGIVFVVGGIMSAVIIYRGWASERCQLCGCKATACSCVRRLWDE